MNGRHLSIRRLPASWRAALGPLVLAFAVIGHEAQAGSATQQAQTVRVSITADEVTVSPARVRAGPVTFRVTNNASVPYDLDVDGPGPDGEIENLAAGATRNLTMTLRPGTYRIESSAESGPDRERRATLTVEG